MKNKEMKEQADKLVEELDELDAKSLEHHLTEKLADYAHEAWSGWMKYMFGNSCKNSHGEIIIPRDLVSRWSRQMNTPYRELPENEKESDRKEARKMLEIVKAPLENEAFRKGFKRGTQENYVPETN